MGAIISPCGKYRYYLQRPLEGKGRRVVFVMLNPSTADAERDDPTIRRCLGFARREGASMLQVVNLFAYRATDPLELLKQSDPAGPENGGHLFAACTYPGALVIAAWGAGGTPEHSIRFQELARAWGVSLWCLGRTKDGSPKHPLYVKGTTQLERFA